MLGLLGRVAAVGLGCSGLDVGKVNFRGGAWNGSH